MGDENGWVCGVDKDIPGIFEEISAGNEKPEPR